ncbi:MAG: nucleoside recognition protein, partial [Clostridia bacterium]|nr:nucleoside recognition protein [Clostridia bacterium]
DENSPAMSAIVMNIVANLLGMGNAATPLGIKAIRELNELNKRKRVSTDEMCMFVVINTASIQLLPATLISMRQTYGSGDAGEVIVPVWIVSVCALAVGICVAKFLERRGRL